MHAASGMGSLYVWHMADWGGADSTVVGNKKLNNGWGRKQSKTADGAGGGGLE